MVREYTVYFSDFTISLLFVHIIVTAYIYRTNAKNQRVTPPYLIIVSDKLCH